ncbi:MAG: imidazole glycerol phosphate synthase subunit HisH [Dehalococcoidaceae bacterium]|nr:imidazole glycerol phosphate synthase subunit HisH [Dehalococcoidaceae bacterium]
MIAVIDYGAGNIRSVVNAVNSLGFEPLVTSDPEDIRRADKVILPGVGAAGSTVESLKQQGLDAVIAEYIAAGRPFMGICIGMQVLFDYTEEGGGAECLGIIPGRVKKLPASLKVPHMGWNQVSQINLHPVFNGIEDGVNFYFVHSYYVEPEDDGIIIGSTRYGIDFASAVASGNLVAVQFHPEKSGKPGLKIYNNFLQPQ